MHKTLTPVLSLICLSVSVLAQSQPSQPAANENGAIQVYGGAGWSFGLPAVQAFVSVQGLGSVSSPNKKTLAAPSFGVTVRAWRFVVPFADFTAYDTGKATASIGSASSTSEATTFSFHGGARFVAGKSRFRGYGEFRAGMLHQSLTATFNLGGQGSSASASDSTRSLMYGGGMQIFAGRRWRSDIGFDAFHTGVSGPGQNYSRIRIGVFFQTKSTVR